MPRNRLFSILGAIRNRIARALGRAALWLLKELGIAGQNLTATAVRALIWLLFGSWMRVVMTSAVALVALTVHDPVDFGLVTQYDLTLLVMVGGFWLMIASVFQKKKKKGKKP